MEGSRLGISITGLEGLGLVKETATSFSQPAKMTGIASKEGFSFGSFDGADVDLSGG